MAFIQPVSWSQSAIIKVMKDIFGALSGTRAVTVANSKEIEILGRLDEVVYQLERMNIQLAMATGNDIEFGERL